MRRSRQTRRQSLDAGDWSSSQDTSSFGQVQPSAEISRPRSSDDVDNVDDELAYDDSPTLPISHDNSYSQWDENVRSVSDFLSSWLQGHVTRLDSRHAVISLPFPI